MRGGRLAPMDFQLIGNLENAVNAAQNLLGHLLLVVGANDAAQGHASAPTFHFKILATPVRSFVKNAIDVVGELNVRHGQQSNCGKKVLAISRNEKKRKETERNGKLKKRGEAGSYIP